MSILIKGIDLPKDATSITVEWWGKDDMQVRIDEFGDHEISDRVIEIPTPHGRLIDADKVFTYSFLDETNLAEVETIIEEEE